MKKTKEYKPKRNILFMCGLAVVALALMFIAIFLPYINNAFAYVYSYEDRGNFYDMTIVDKTCSMGSVYKPIVYVDIDGQQVQKTRGSWMSYEGGTLQFDIEFEEDEIDLVGGIIKIDLILYGKNNSGYVTITISKATEFWGTFLKIFLAILSVASWVIFFILLARYRKYNKSLVREGSHSRYTAIRTLGQMLNEQMSLEEEIARNYKEQFTPPEPKFVACEYCGTENRYEAKKCESCGARLSRAKNKK